MSEHLSRRTADLAGEVLCPGRRAAQYGGTVRTQDSLLEEAGFEPSVPLRNQGTLRLHSELFDPMIATHNGRLVKTIGGSDQPNARRGNPEATFTFDEITALPPPIAARIGFPSIG